MSTHSQRLGGWGERQAERYLVDKGYRVVERNVRTEYGEIDLVAQEGDVLVFVEVKTRSSSTYGYPEEAITEKKEAHLMESAQAYLQANPEGAQDWRIDVVAVRGRAGGQSIEITHFENAIQ